MSNRQQIAEPQSGAVGHQYPRSHQQRVCDFNATRQGLAGNQQVIDLAVTPCHGARRRPLDSPKGTEYTPVHQAFLGRKAQEDAQHTPVIVNRMSTQPGQGIGQVGIDCFGMEVLCRPGKSLNENQKLFPISSRTTDAINVPPSKIVEIHEGTIGGSLPSMAGVATPPDNRYIPPGDGQLAQLVRTPVLAIVRASLAPLPANIALRLNAVYRQLISLQDAAPKDGHRRIVLCPTDGAFLF